MMQRLRGLLLEGVGALIENHHPLRADRRVGEVPLQWNPIRFVRRAGDDQNERGVAFEPTGKVPLIAQKLERRVGLISERAQRRLALHLNDLSGGPQLVIAKLDEPVGSSIRSRVSGRPKVPHLFDNAFDDIDPALTDPDAFRDGFCPASQTLRWLRG